MKKVLRKILPYIIYLLVLAMEVYTLFIYEGKESRWLHYVLMVGFILALIIPIVALLVMRYKNSKRFAKFILAFLIVLVLVQIISLPIANIYSKTLPAWPPRGSVYQFPGLRNSVSLNEFGLFMGYYLDGKTLYALACDDPKDFDNGVLFMSDQYDFKPLDSLKVNTAYHPNDNPDIYYMGVREDRKRQVPGFTLHIYTALDHQSYDNVALIKDKEGNWHIGPKDILLEEAVSTHE